MGILKDAGETIVKYGEIIINKTEEIAKIAKLNLDIKRLKIDQGIAEKELGRHVITKIDGGTATINASDAKVKEMHQKVTSLNKSIEGKKADIEKIKAESKEKTESKHDKKPESGSQ
ncbi:MAG: hypothetical protein A2176_15415 [Spirochaetes bacterium RBG_13_51_14]|nr:MAG: hypothetical protein A2176_15415 [Spirochaetes bacterium RBG_13_51_14]